MLPGQQLQQHDAEGVDVGVLGGSAGGSGLGGAVRVGLVEEGGRGQSEEAVAGGGGGGGDGEEVEIGDVGVEVGVEEEVGGLEVAMHELAGAAVVEMGAPRAMRSCTGHARLCFPG